MSAFLPARRDLSSSDGVAMVIVLWVIMVLSLLISGFAFTMYVETQVASFSRKELKAEELARSGVEVARMEVLAKLLSRNQHGKVESYQVSCQSRVNS